MQVLYGREQNRFPVLLFDLSLSAWSQQQESFLLCVGALRQFLHAKKYKAYFDLNQLKQADV
jgi:hypothetical protein